jgi:hypothetical protein
MNPLRARTLDFRAVAYVRECLAGWGAKSLSKFLKQRADLGLGSIKAYLPADVSELDSYEFHEGGKLPPYPLESHRKITARDGSRWVAVPVPSAAAQLADEIDRFLHAATVNPIVVFEDALASPNDPCVKELRRALFCGSDVFHAILPTDGRADIDETVRRVGQTHPTLVGAMTSLQNGYSVLESSRDVCEGTVEELAKKGCQADSGRLRRGRLLDLDRTKRRVRVNGNAIYPFHARLSQDTSGAAGLEVARSARSEWKGVHELHTLQPINRGSAVALPPLADSGNADYLALAAPAAFIAALFTFLAIIVNFLSAASSSFNVASSRFIASACPSSFAYSRTPPYPAIS